MAKRKNKQQNKQQQQASQQQTQQTQPSQNQDAAVEAVNAAEQQPNNTNNNNSADQNSQNSTQQEESKQQQMMNNQEKSCGHCGHCANNTAQSSANVMGNVAFADGDDPMMVQPKFNISETVEVVHMGPAGHNHQFKNKNATNNGRFQPQQQQQQQPIATGKGAIQQPSKQDTAQWNQFNPANQPMNNQRHHQRQQATTSEYGRNPVVTMHDLIDQEERQASEQQKAQRQQQQQSAPLQQPMGEDPHHHHACHQQEATSMSQPEDMGAEADDEEGEEESEEEDTEEEGIYGPEDGQDDDLSDEIEDEHQWTAQAQPANGGQYHQPGTAQAVYQGQPAQPGQAGYQQPQDGSQYYGNNATNQANSGQGHHNHPQGSQNYAQGANNNQTAQQHSHYQQQHAQGHQQQQQQQQRNQAQQNAADSIESRLHQYLTDMLINLYNGKATDEYRDHYAQVVTILDEQKKIQELNNEKPSITISSLQQLFQTKIENIVGTVRDKLQEDAKKDNLVQEIDVPVDQSTQQQQPNVQDANRRQVGQQPQQAVNKMMKAKEYRGELQKNFDEILSAVGDYFDLFKNNTDKLEALWLQLLEYVDVSNTNQCRIFRQMHYSIYIKIVIKNKTIMAIIKEAQRWNNTPHASKALKEHLDKIKQIENDSHPMIPETYENFNKRAALDFDLNEYTYTDFIQKQQQLERQQQQNQQQMRQAQNNNNNNNNSNNNSTGNNTNGANNNADNVQSNNSANSNNNTSACNRVFQDCKQFENHQRLMQGATCKCKCYAKNCTMNHFNGVNAKGQRKQQSRVQDKQRQAKRSDVVPAEYDYADEQVYNKNIDDLMDYIMKPQADGKKNKKKPKKNKRTGEDVEEEAKTNKEGSNQTPQPLQSQINSSNGPEVGKVSQRSQSQADTNQSTKQRKKTSTSSNKRSGGTGDDGSSPEKEVLKVEVRSTSRKAPKERKATSAVAKRNQSQSKIESEAQQPADQAAINSDDESNKELKSEEEFEAEIADFAQQLERNCQQVLANHARKLRPNYEERWIVELKLRLKNLDSKKPGQTTQSQSSNSSSKTAPSASGHSRKH